MESLIKGQKGLAKKELKKVLKKEKVKISKIQDHIKKGDSLLEKQKNKSKDSKKEEKPNKKEKEDKKQIDGPK